MKLDLVIRSLDKLQAWLIKTTNDDSKHLGVRVTEIAALDVARHVLREDMAYRQINGKSTNVKRKNEEIDRLKHLQSVKQREVA